MVIVRENVSLSVRPTGVGLSLTLAVCEMVSECEGELVVDRVFGDVGVDDSVTRGVAVLLADAVICSVSDKLWDCPRVGELDVESDLVLIVDVSLKVMVDDQLGDLVGDMVCRDAV